MLGKKKLSAYKGNQYKNHSYIARNTEVVGDIVFVGGLHVEGRVTGNILSDEGTLHVHGEVQGEVRVPHVIINGHITGNIYAGEHIELASRAVITGNVYYKTMEMMLGAQVNGGLLHASDQQGTVIDQPAEAPALAEPPAGNS